MHTVQPIESLGDSQRRICTDAINGRNSQRFVVSGRRPGKCSYCDSGPTLVAGRFEIVGYTKSEAQAKAAEKKSWGFTARVETVASYYTKMLAKMGG
jgi:hypothetical protein